MHSLEQTAAKLRPARQLGRRRKARKIYLTNPGDFDDNANALWSLHDGVLIFAGLFSAALTSFFVDKIHDLQSNPAQQMVYYQQQNVALLVPDLQPGLLHRTTGLHLIHSTSTLRFSHNRCAPRDSRQQWVRDYMHVFQRYGNPLKSALLRQYLYEGAEGWYIPVVAESVPGLVHVSLFLFFLGLGDLLLNVNTTIGVTTIVPITSCAFLYVFSIRFIREATGIAQSGGSLKAVSSNISEGQMQLAMEESDERKGRDCSLNPMAYSQSDRDDEMESFAAEVKRYEDMDLRQNGADLRISIIRHHHFPLFQRTCHPLGLLRSLGRI
ncbi:hypothetical protein H4582DRAFT_2098469 [Lactarius indigo]|nr:hypothetical protein H4582DRAFT_2098469 [Lactarius indigo]